MKKKKLQHKRHPAPKGKAHTAHRSAPQGRGGRAPAAPESVGIFEGNRRGFGFVRTEDGGRDVFVAARHGLGALDGDTVRVSVTRGGDRPEGEITEIITRARENAADTTTLRLAIGVTEDSTTSQCALWSSLLGLWQVLTTHNVPLLPPVFAPAGGQASAITFVCIAKASPSAQDDLPPQVEQQIRETMANRPFLARDADENM
jgi:cold shock CspA family protein